MFFHKQAVRKNHVLEFDLTTASQNKPSARRAAGRSPRRASYSPDVNLGILQISAVVVFVLLTALAAGIVVAWLNSPGIAHFSTQVVSLEPVARLVLLL